MANDVFANGREISCKKADGKTICEFPDVCFTPPENPATPPGVPVPYPNTAFAKDTTDGSKSVKISEQEVMLKNKSYFKKSTGDEAGCAAKKGVITSTNKGKAYFISWSMDVKVEDENVVRHLDMTTNNHASPLANGALPMIHKDRIALINLSDNCEKEKNKINDECGDPFDSTKAECPDGKGVEDAKAFQKEARSVFEKNIKNRAEGQAIVDRELEYYALEVQENKCLNALACALIPYNDGVKNSSKRTCCPHQTPDHLIPASQFGTSERGAMDNGTSTGYKDGYAPSMCATGGKSTATHGLLGRGRKEYMVKNNITESSTKKNWTLKKSAKCGAYSANQVQSHCSPECLEAQLLEGHKSSKVGNFDENTPLYTKQENVNLSLDDFAKTYKS